MAKFIDGTDAEEALIETSGITKSQLTDKLVEVATVAEKVSGGDVTIMLNIFAQGLTSIVAELERHGEADILDVTIATITSGVEKIRAETKARSN